MHQPIRVPLNSPTENLCIPAADDECSLYFHLPQIVKNGDHDEETQGKLCCALRAEWQSRRASIGARRVRSVYFGGNGTCFFPLAYLQRLLEDLDLAGNVEITFELHRARPSFPFLRALKKFGINRIELSVDTREQAPLRIQNKYRLFSEELKVIERLDSAGFSNISIDLVVPLPGQNLEYWSQVLKCVDSWPIQHIALREERANACLENLYEICEEEKEEFSVGMLDLWTSSFSKRRWERYEQFAQCRPGSASVHNLGYLRGRAYWGFGPSACSFWDLKRMQNTSNCFEHLKAMSRGGPPAVSVEEISITQRLRELLLVHLRVVRGVDLSAFETRWGEMPFTRKELQPWQDLGCLKISKAHMQLTSLGARHYDAVASDLI